MKLAGRNLNVVCDPVEGMNIRADVVTWSSNLPEGEGEVYTAPAGVMVLDGPGDYEVKGAMITGVPAQLHIDESGQRGTAYSIVIDGLNIVVTGNISGKLAQDEVEKLGQVDVVVVPVGGNGLTLDAEGAAAVVAQLEPSWVVPVHYDDGVSKYPMPQAGVDLFLKEMGSNPEPENKLRISQKEPPAETQVVLLTRVGS